MEILASYTTARSKMNIYVKFQQNPIINVVVLNQTLLSSITSEKVSDMKLCTTITGNEHFCTVLLKSHHACRRGYNDNIFDKKTETERWSEMDEMSLDHCHGKV